MTTRNIFTKAPGETLNYSWNWQNHLPDGVSISSAEVLVPVGLTQVGTTTITEPRVSVVISGGTLHTTYPLVCTMTRSDGVTLTRLITINIEER